MKKFWFNFRWRCIYLYDLYIKKIHDCDNCKYFGGLMCDHVDENYNCLGWESAGWHPIKTWLYNYRLKKFVKKMKKMDALGKQVSHRSAKP